MRISQLETIVGNGGQIALWGWGREGRAAWRAIRSKLPELALTVFCQPGEVDEVRGSDPTLTVETDASAQRLSAFDVVVKSPGISPYGSEAKAAAEQGTRFIGGTALWFAEHPQARTICITGTKGKSTTTALIAHLLRAGGHRTALAGNIGLPLLELLDGEAELWVIELSSYQTGDVADSGVRPEVAVVLNIFPEHLDWHGSEQRYVDDKLALLTEARPRIAVLNANDKTLQALVGAPHAVTRHGRDRIVAKSIAPMPHNGMGRSYKGDVCWFGRADGWHPRDDGIYRGNDCVLAAGSLPLSGAHNRSNLCAALAAIEALGLDAVALAPHAATFQPLPHRLQVLGARDGITYVNDSISTTPYASLAALEVHRGRRVALLVGGHDRGLDWSGFVEAMRSDAPVAIITMGQNGPRIHALLEHVAMNGGLGLSAASDLVDAMSQAQALLDGDGVVLLSPGAPSFGPYRDYTERGRHFATLAGFDGDAISTIQGLGIA